MAFHYLSDVRVGGVDGKRVQPDQMKESLNHCLLRKKTLKLIHLDHWRNHMVNLFHILS